VGYPTEVDEVNIKELEELLGSASAPDNTTLEMRVYHKEEDGSVRQCSVAEIPKEERAKIAIDALVNTMRRLNDFVQGRDPRQSSRH
jgi:hypothetical protein